MEYAKNVTETNKRLEPSRQTKPAPEGAGGKLCETANPYELAFSTVTARRFCDQHEMSLPNATRRSLPQAMVPIPEGSMARGARKFRTQCARPPTPPTTA